MSGSATESSRTRRIRLVSVVLASIAVVAVVSASLAAMWTNRSGSPRAPLVLITLNGIANRTFNGSESYEFNVTWIEPSVTAKCIQFHLGDIGGNPIAQPFGARLTRAGGADYALYNSSDSAWDGNGASDAFCSDGGWIAGANDAVQVGYSLTLVVPVVHSEAVLMVGVSSEEGVSDTWFALAGEIYPAG